MHNIKELVKKLCPNGVKFVELSNKDLFKFYYGKGNKIPEDVGGIYNVYGANGIVSHINEYNCEDITIIGHIGAVGMINRCKEKCFVTYNGTIAEVVDKSKVNTQYFYYVLTTLNLPSYKKGSQPFLSFSDFKNIKIPVPPIEVQNEIVQILDNFIELKGKLEGELEARKKQYEYYKNQLFKFDSNNIKYKRVDFEKIAYFSQGLQVDVKEQYFEPFENSIQFLRIVDFVNDRELPRYIKRPDEKYIKNENELIMIRYGASAAGKVFINKKGAIANNMFKINLTSKEIDVNYLKYFLSQEKNYNLLNSSSGKSTMPAINFRFLGKLKIDYPSLDEQKRIVKILDRFDKLCNDIFEGLPAEIEARRKQYEYYRDKLLNFKELKVKKEE